MGNHNIKAVIKDGTVADVKKYLEAEPTMKDHTDRFGWTPCHMAVEYHKLDVLKFLIEEAKADTKHIDNAHSNLLHHALHHAENHFDIVTYLLENGQFKFDAAKDEHGNTSLHLAFKYCTLKEIAGLNKYYKGLRELFNEQNDHHQTPLGILRERCKHSPDALAIVEKLREDIENMTDSPYSSKHNSDEEHPHKGSGGKKKSGEHKRKSEEKEQKEEHKKHSDDEKEHKGSHHHKGSSSHKKHSDEEKEHKGSHHHKGSSSHKKKHSDEEEQEHKGSHKKKHSGEETKEHKGSHKKKEQRRAQGQGKGRKIQLKKKKQ